MRILSKVEFFLKNKIKILFLSWIFIITFLMFYSRYIILFPLNENQIISVYSSASQIIGGLYGLIITSYIFFRNELERKSSYDETLETIIDYIKKDYFHFIKFLSLYVIISIVLSLIIILYQNNLDNMLFRILLNIGGFTLIFSFITILILVLTMVNPKSIELASEIINNELSNKNNDREGSYEDFHKYYTQIENILNKYKGSVISDNGEKIISFVTTKAVLKRLMLEKKIDNNLFARLLRIIQYRNSLIHSNINHVGNEYIEEAKNLSEILLSL